MANIRDQEPGLLLVDREPFTSHGSLLRIELGDTLLCVCDEHQVIRIEKFARHTSAKLTRKSLQHQDKEEWARDRTLMHTNSNIKPWLCWPWTCIRLRALEYIPWLTSPFLNPKAPLGPPLDLPWYTIEGFLKVDEGKLEQSVSSDVLFLQLANNEDGVSGTSPRQKAELHLVDVHHLTDVGV